MIKDYFGHEIHEGDILLYNKRGCHGHHTSFSEGIAVGFERGRVKVLSREYYDENCLNWYEVKFGTNIINLTALNIRERIEI